MNLSHPADERLELASAWLSTLAPRYGLRPDTLRPASSDASFRRYFRVDARDAASYILMDAPPEREDCRPFVRVAALIASQGVHTPRVHESDLARGFLLLSDLGTLTYSDALARPGTDVEGLYRDALAALVRLQHADAAGQVPDYDEARLLAELRLFPDWYVARHLGVELAPAEREVLEEGFRMLCAAALAQRRVLVHRDYHCRNLMALAPEQGNPGVLDFQDAVVGPVSYDLVSLLRDAYVDWPEDRQIDWAARYWEQARRAGLPVPGVFDEFWRDLEWMGLQRSLKILGIFARLHYRDGKARYLDDLPLVLRQAQHVAQRYDALARFARLLDRIHGRERRAGYTF
jgi:N-acetylmuramate 1-kinase